jgi:hypothetical protein
MKRCWYYQLALQRAAEHKSRLSPRAQKHLDACPECQEYFETQKVLEQRLAFSATELGPSVSPYLRGRVRAGVQAMGPRQFGYRPQFGWVGIFAMVAMVFMILSHNRTSPRVTAIVAVPPVHIVPPATTETPGVIARSLPALTAQLEDPLATEMKSVITDAKSAVTLLAKNFLPE